MDGEIFFRRAVFGGFNREDVMRYISSVSFENDGREKTEAQLKKSLNEITALKDSLNSKNAEIEALKMKVAALESETRGSEELKAKVSELEKRNGIETAADKLMRDSMAYAERYVESAGVMAQNIRNDAVEKVNTANAKIAVMLEKIDELSSSSAEFEALLKGFKADFEQIEKDFSTDNSESK